MKPVVVISLVVMFFMLAYGLYAIWHAYRIYVKKEYAIIKVSHVEPPKYPEKIAGSIAIVELVLAIVSFGIVVEIPNLGIVEACRIGSIFLLVLLIVKRRLVSSASSQT